MSDGDAEPRKESRGGEERRGEETREGILLKRMLDYYGVSIDS